MSRSFKKNPFSRAEKSKSSELAKSKKKISRAFRRKAGPEEDVPSGKFYRKAVDGDNYGDWNVKILLDEDKGRRK